MKREGDGTDSDSDKPRKKGKKVDATDYKKSKKKGKKGDATDYKKSKKKGKKVDATDYKKSKKKGKIGGGKSSEKKREGPESEWEHLPHLPVPIIWGRRSKKDAETWMCKCGARNRPSRHVFVDLPSFKCSNKNCVRRPKHVEFRFSYGNMVANGVCPIGDLIYIQRTPDCLLFALAKGCEIAANIRNTVLGNGKRVRPLNPFSFKKHLEMMNGGVELDQIETGSPTSKQRVRELLATEGLRELGGQNVYRFGTLDCDLPPVSDDDDCSDKREFSEKDFALANEAFVALATSLANGSPVVTSINLGRKFKHLEYGKVYKQPENGQSAYVTDETGNAKEVEITHSVVLVGAARKGRLDYYYFLNSHGVKFCVRVDNETGRTIGGIGKISAEDAYLGEPFKILTFG